MDGLTALRNDASSWNQANLTDLNRRVLRPGRSLHTSHRGSYARDQFAGAEGLGYIIIGARLKRLDLLLFSIPNGDHQNWQSRRKRSNAAQRLKSANSWHIDVQQNSVKASSPQLLDSFFTAGGFHDLKSEIKQRWPQCPADG